MHELRSGLETGFINRDYVSDKSYQPHLVVNDKDTGERVLSSIVSELEKCDGFFLSVAFVTESGVQSILQPLLDLEKKGVRGKILTSQYLNFTQPKALRRLMALSNIELKISTEGNLHSKGYIFQHKDLYSLIVGSSNLTQNALSKNAEWNLKISSAKEGKIVDQALSKFDKGFDRAQPVTDSFVEGYERIYEEQFAHTQNVIENEGAPLGKKIIPNLMQEEALLNIETLRTKGVKKALLVSATATGKTYLSAFDVQKFKAKRLLFLVHRRTIAEEAKQTFKSLFGVEVTMGVYSGAERDTESNFIFSTVQTMSRDGHLEKFNRDHFDYIVIDETHRAAAKSYTKIMDYFEPKFLLGMTATPERTDGENIFELFDNNIAYEIRLHRALQEDMLCPFHYYGVTDIEVNNHVLSEESGFNDLTSEERVERIIEKSQLYGHEGEETRSLVFCSRVDECQSLSEKFNKRGYRSAALTGESSEDERRDAIDSIQSNSPDRLKYIFSRDIFNEGVDIPRINQIIMIRPTQSAIIFVQQLGRGLRKADGKSYLTVIDFIGNYNNNYLLPVALYGDSSYDKDRLRKLLSGKNQGIPGESTVNFDLIAKEQIFKAIDQARMCSAKSLKEDYENLKYKLGRSPMMMDFIHHGSRDPFQYVQTKIGSRKKRESYFEFVCYIGDELNSAMAERQQALLESLNAEVNNAKRIEESFILKAVLESGRISTNDLKSSFLDGYGYTLNEQNLKSAVRNLNLKYATDRHDGQIIPIGDIHNFKVIDEKDSILTAGEDLTDSLENKTFSLYLKDSIDYSLYKYNSIFNLRDFEEGFLLYQKYRRKDIFRILNWRKQPVEINIGGYRISPDETNCAIFVTYEKSENISLTTQYEDEFLSASVFKWMSRTGATLQSKEIRKIEEGDLRIPLFIKKSDDEGKDFYYMGELTPKSNGFEQTSIENEQGQERPIVKVLFSLNPPVEESLFQYITSENND